MVTFSRLTQEDLQLSGQRSPAIRQYLNQLQGANPISRLRHEGWITAAHETLHGKTSSRDVLRAWSKVADEVLKLAWRTSGLDQMPCALVALGKLGAEELNLSSDVDLIVVAKDGTVEACTKALRNFRTALLDPQTEQPLLRLDFDLRPGGRFSPLVPSLTQLLDYYWSHGETWERLAWVRSRVVVGKKALTDEIVDFAEKFCFRKYLDYTVLEDLKNLRARIHSSTPLEPGEIHLKLGPGGIRDIELYLHALLVINGGKNSNLRSRFTDEACDKLATAGLLPIGEAEDLKSAYWRLRHFENLVQSVEDRQSHSIFPERETLISPEEIQEIKSLNSKVDRLVTGLMGPAQSNGPLWPTEPEAQIEWLSTFGISRELAENIWPKLESLTALSRRSEKDELARREFLLRYLTALKGVDGDRDLGLELLFEFVKAVRAKASFFSLLLQEPRLVRDLAHLFSVSPYFGQVLTGRPELLDSWVFGSLPPTTADWDEIIENCLEARLLNELNSSMGFLSDMDVVKLGESLSRTADEIVSLILGKLVKDHGAQPIGLLALGKWGGRELGLRADLDFVLVCEQPPGENEFRVARRFISHLTSHHKGGSLYNVDLRLRPSGQAGPLMVEIGKLKKFLQSEAKAWQRQSYLRMRFVADASNRFQLALAAQGLNLDDRAELIEIRTKLIRQSKPGIIDLKYSPGGLLTIEFLAQISILAEKLPALENSTSGMLGQLAQHHPMRGQDYAELKRIYLELRLLEQLHQFTSHHSGSEINQGGPELTRLARARQLDDRSLVEFVEENLARAQSLCSHLDPLKPSH